MTRTVSRRHMIQSATAAGITASLWEALAPACGAAVESTPALWPGFPRQDAKQVAQIVGAAHTDLKKVSELLDQQPALANAWWDWGFGDWESALGAAAHTGRRAIADRLLDSGARIDIFAAAMLGMTDVVKALVAARPGIERTVGPHGIPLLAHAKVGGAKASDTLAYLHTLPDAGKGILVVPLPTADHSHYLGKYRGKDVDIQLVVKQNSGGLLVMEVTVPGHVGTNRIHHLGNHEFFPAGVPSIKIRFEVSDNQARTISIAWNNLSLSAAREVA